MKFANVDGLKREAQPKLRGQCLDCNTIMIAKCGDHNLWHWAHYRKSDCDHWWEPETPWHRAWKNEFPEDWQEVRHSASDGEVHRADVKTEKGKVLEFQNSAISPAEKLSRENFYRPMNWVVNGTNYKKDLPTFRRALGSALFISFAPVRLMMFVQGCSILERWAGSLCPVYLDFGDAVFDLGYQIKKPTLWRLDYLKQINRVVVTPVSCSSFIDHHRNNGQLGLFKFPQRKTSPPPQRSPQPRARTPSKSQMYLRRFDRYLLR
jgi:competence protein CoiA